MSTLFGIICEMIPDASGNEKVVMHRTTFTTRGDAEKEQTQLRRQNLPFRSWVIPIEDPRGEAE